MNEAHLNQFGAMCLLIADRLQDSDERIVGRLSSAAAALVSIGNYPGETIDELKGVLDISHSGTVRLIDRLVEDGLVERARDTKDTRRVRLGLTKAGKRLFKELQTAREETLTEFIGEHPNQAEFLEQCSVLLRNLPMTRQAADRACRLCNESVCRPEICPVEQAVANN